MLGRLFRTLLAILTLMTSTPPALGVAMFVTAAGALHLRLSAANAFAALSLLTQLRFAVVQARRRRVILLRIHVARARVLGESRW